MLMSLRDDVYRKVLSGEKIYEHRKVFPDEPVKAYIYVSTPTKAICGIMYLSNRTSFSFLRNTIIPCIKNLILNCITFIVEDISNRFICATFIVG